MENDTEFSADYQQRLVYANYGCTPIARNHSVATEEMEVKPVVTTTPQELMEEQMGFEWNIRLQGSSLKVSVSSPDHPNGLPPRVVVLPISSATLALMRILAAVNRKVGVEAPTCTVTF